MIYVYCETCGHAIDKIKERIDQYDIPGAREQKSIYVSEVYCKECAKKLNTTNSLMTTRKDD